MTEMTFHRRHTRRMKHYTRHVLVDYDDSPAWYRARARVQGGQEAPIQRINRRYASTPFVHATLLAAALDHPEYIIGRKKFLADVWHAVRRELAMESGPSVYVHDAPELARMLSAALESETGPKGQAGPYATFLDENAPVSPPSPRPWNPNPVVSPSADKLRDLIFNIDRAGTGRH